MQERIDIVFEYGFRDFAPVYGFPLVIVRLCLEGFLESGIGNDVRRIQTVGLDQGICFGICCSRKAGLDIGKPL